MKSIFELGVSESYPAYLQKKIKLSNQIAVLLFVLCIPYLVFSIISYPGLLIFPIAVNVVSVVVLVLNVAHIHLLSRFLVSIVVNLAVTGYHVYLIQEGEALIISLYIIHLSLLIIPLLVFDLREKVMLTITTVLCVMVFLSVSRINGYFEEPYDNSVFKTGFMGDMGIVIGIIILMVGLSVFLRTNLASEINNERLVAEMESRNQELTASQDSLRDYISKLKDTQEEEKKRNWAAEGFALFGEVLRTNNEDIVKLSDVLIAKLVKYLDINQGALFLLNEEDPQDVHLELSACYAYDRKKFLNRRINIGEGIVGQTFIEKQVTILKKVPDGYLRITSGLGQATAQCVIVVPLMVNNEVQGVVELASFKQLEPHQIEFVKKLGENIASTLVNVKNNQRTKKLLEESQQKAEILRSQEEEMRQNMEELTATQEEMQRQAKESLELKRMIEADQERKGKTGNA